MSVAGTTELLNEQAPNGKAFSVTLSDSTETHSIGFHCNVSGSLGVEFDDGSTAVIKVLQGLGYPYHVNKYLVTGTVTIGNGDIIGFYKGQ